jgi:ABC-2 type transport system permease protein
MSSTEVAATFTPGLWSSVWKLLKLRILILLSDFRHAKTSRKIGIVFLALLFLGFLVFIFVISLLLLSALRSPELAAYIGDFQPYLDSIPVVILSAAFLGILLTSFGVLLQALYLAGDMDFLLSAPLPIRAVFITKLLQAILPNFALISLFVLPILYGLGASQGYNWLYYPFVLIMLAALALAAAGIASLLVMMIVRIFPARRVAEVLGFVGGLATFICSQSGQLANIEGVSQSQATQALELVRDLNTPWSPLAWPGRGLVSLGEGHWLAGGGFYLFSMALSAVVFGMALVTAERLYYSGWASIHVGRKKKAPRRQRRERPFLLGSLVRGRISSPILAVIGKDFSVLRRDIRNMSQLVTPLIFGIVYAVMFLRGSGDSAFGRGGAPPVVMELLKNAVVYGNVGISLFVGWMLLARLGNMGFSQEGRSYWMLKSAPVSVRQLMTAKFLVAFLPSLVLGWVFLLGISLIQRASLGTLLFTLPVVALVIAGNAGLNLAFGIVGANLNWEDPRKMMKGSSGCLSSLVSIVYLGVSLVLFFGPPLLFSLLSLSKGLGELAGLIVGGLFSLGFAFVPLWLVRERVPRLGETD